MTKIKVIIDSNFGDSGKGQATDYFAYDASLTGKSCTVVLSNGGSQRGHTVTLSNGKRHVFRHFGSGSFAGAKTYFPEQYILNPMNFVLEVGMLGFVPSCYVHPNCLVSTPFDMIANQIIEDARGDARHGSCGVGIWETILRNGLTYGEMVNLYYADDKHEKLQDYLSYVKDYFIKRISGKGIKINQEWDKIINNDGLIDSYMEDFGLMVSNIQMSETIPESNVIIFENGQGLLLDQNIIGYGKNTTPSNTGLQNPSEMIKKIKGEKDVEVCYVSRTYMTRHGMGRFDTEYDIISFKDETNRTHPYQGALRFGILDTQEMIDRCLTDFNRYAEPDWKISFMLTHTNEIKAEEKLFLGHRLYLSDNPTRNSILTID